MNESANILNNMPEFTKIGSFGFFFWAILIGIFLSVFINMGPSFITLLQTSIHRGFRSAFWFVLGVFLNDVMIIALCILTSIEVVMRSHQEFSLFIIAAGIILFLFGLFTFFRKVKNDEALQAEENKRVAETDKVLKEKQDTPSWIIFFGKGFLINILNPFVWFFWFSSVAIVAANMGGNKITTMVFFAIIMGTSLGLELLKAWGAASLKRFFNAKRIRIMNKIVGVVLMLFGLYFIVIRGILNF